MIQFFLSPIRKRYKRWNRKLTLSKRQQFVIITLLLTAGLLLTQLVPADYRYPMVVGLSVLTYLSAAFALRDDLQGIEWLTLLTLPTLFTSAVALFYFLLPERWLTRVPVVVLYTIGMYALLLTENIYNVAANRTIALLRAAHSIGYLITLVTYFFLMQTVLAFRMLPLLSVPIIGLITLAMIVQALWPMELEPRISRRVRALAFPITLTIMEFAWTLSFWPVPTTLFALFLTTWFYATVGMAQLYLVERLFKRSVIEFLSVVGIVLCLLLFATHWRGNY